MKSFIISLVILCSVILSVVSAAIYSHNALTELEATISEGTPDNYEQAMNEAKRTESGYKRLKPFLSLFNCDSEVREMEMYIADIKSAIIDEDAAALTAAKSRLRLHIDQLRRLSAFSIEAIF